MEQKQNIKKRTDNTLKKLFDFSEANTASILFYRVWYTKIENQLPTLKETQSICSAEQVLILSTEEDYCSKQRTVTENHLNWLKACYHNEQKAIPQIYGSMSKNLNFSKELYSCGIKSVILYKKWKIGVI